MSRSIWSRVADIWSPDDPAIVRGRAPQPSPEAPQPAQAVELAQVPVQPRPEPLSPAERRARIEVLVARLELEAGDTVAAEQLRVLLDGA